MRVAIVQSAINGRWGYCLDECRETLRLDLDEKALYPSAAAAREAAVDDDSFESKLFEFTDYPAMQTIPIQVHTGIGSGQDLTVPAALLVCPACEEQEFHIFWLTTGHHQHIQCVHCGRSYCDNTCATTFAPALEKNP